MGKDTLINYLNNNPRLVKDFKKWFSKEKKTTTTYGSTNGKYVSEYRCYESKLNEIKTIIFYQWSDINSKVILFTSLREFYDFLKECKIIFPSWNITNNLEKWNNFHVICIPNKAEIIAAETKEELEKEFDKFIKK